MDDRQSPLGIVPTVIWQSTLLSYNLISATTPLLKGFTQGFMTAGIALGYSREGTMAGGYESTGSYQLRSLKRTKSRPNAPNGLPQDVTKLQVYDTLVQGNVRQQSAGSRTSSMDESRQCHKSVSIASHGSRQIMIKREWRF